MSNPALESEIMPFCVNYYLIAGCVNCYLIAGYVNCYLIAGYVNCYLIAGCVNCYLIAGYVNYYLIASCVNCYLITGLETLFFCIFFFLQKQFVRKNLFLSFFIKLETFAWDHKYFRFEWVQSRKYKIQNYQKKEKERTINTLKVWHDWYINYEQKPPLTIVLDEVGIFIFKFKKMFSFLLILTLNVCKFLICYFFIQFVSFHTLLLFTNLKLAKVHVICCHLCLLEYNSVSTFC